MHRLLGIFVALATLPGVEKGVQGFELLNGHFKLTDDFGPRKLNSNYDCHGGLDFGTSGQPRLIRAIEGGPIKITGDPWNTIGVGPWQYLHCARGSQAKQASESEYRVFCGSMTNRFYYRSAPENKPVYAKMDMLCIIVYHNDVVEAVYTNPFSKDGKYYDLYLDNDDQKAKTSVEEGEPFAIASNVNTGSIHLHLQRVDRKNPYIGYEHPDPQFTVSIKAPAADDTVMRHSVPATEKRVCFGIDSTTGYDLNEVGLYLVPELTEKEKLRGSDYINAGRTAVNNERIYESRFYFAGETEQALSHMFPRYLKTEEHTPYSTTKGSFARTGIDPYGMGKEDFYYTDLNTAVAANGTLASRAKDARYPDGRYFLHVKATSLNGTAFWAKRSVIIDNWRPQVAGLKTTATGDRKVTMTVAFTEQIDTSKIPNVQIWDPDQNNWVDIAIEDIAWQASSKPLKDSVLQCAVTLPPEATAREVKCRIINVCGLGGPADVIQPADSEKDVDGNELLLIDHRPIIDLTAAGEVSVTLTLSVTEENLSRVTFILDEAAPNEFSEEVPVSGGQAFYTKDVSEEGEHVAKVIAYHEGEPCVRYLRFTVGAGGPNPVEIDPLDLPTVELIKHGPPEGPVRVYYRVDDEDLSQVMVLVDGNPARTVTVPEGGIGHVWGYVEITEPGRRHVVNVFANDKAGNRVSDKCYVFITEPGYDSPPRPDESLDLSGPFYELNSPGRAPGAPVAVLQSGYWRDLAAMTEAFGHSLAPIAPEDFSTALAKEYGVIVIPSSGLQPLASLKEFQDKLDGYVRAGGNLIILAQPESSDYELIPGPVAGMGYVEDTACHNLTGSITSYRPCFAGQKDAIVDGNADGILTGWPDGAEVWLRRIKNGFPALLSYPLGTGRVIISTYYSDFAYSHSQLNDDERRFLRDLLSWITAPNSAIPEVKPGQALQLTVPVTAISLADQGPADHIRIFLRDPDGRLISSRIYEKSVDQGGTVQIAYTFDDRNNELSTNGAGLGIWHVGYELYRGNTLVQPESIAQRVALSLHAEAANTETLAATVQIPGASPFGCPIPFRMIVDNSATGQRVVKCQIFTGLWTDTGLCRETSITVPAGGREELEIPITPAAPSMSPSQPSWYRVRFLDEAGKIVSTEVRQVFVYAPRVHVAYLSENASKPTLTATYGGQIVPAGSGGDSIRVSAVMTPYAGTYVPGRWVFAVADPQSKVVYSKEFDLDLGVLESETKVFEFPLPEPTSPGFYKYAIAGKVDEASVWLEASGPHGVVVSPPDFRFSVLESNLSGTVRLDCQNRSLDSAGVTLTCKSSADGRDTVLAQKAIPAIPAGQSQKVELALDPACFFGDRSHERLALEWGEGAWWQRVAVPMPYAVPELSIAGGWYGRPGTPLQIMAGLRTIGNLSGTVDAVLRVPAAGFEQRFQFTASSSSFATQLMTVSVPASLSAGNYPIVLEIVGNSGVLASTRAGFEIRKAAIRVTPPAQIAGGSMCSFGAVNIGGVSATAAYTLKLTDKNGIEVSMTSSEAFFPLDASNPMSLAVPSDLASGVYRLSWEFKNNADGDVAGSGESLLAVQGADYQVFAETSKQFFALTEPVDPLGRVTTGSGTSIMGNLRMEITRATAGRKLNFGADWRNSRGPQGNYTVDGSIDFATPGYRWRWQHEEEPVVGRVLPGGKRQVVSMEWTHNYVDITDASTGRFLKRLNVGGPSVQLVDANNDGLDEILVRGWESTSSRFELHSASNGLLWSIDIPGKTGGMECGDFDGDGTMEGFVSSNVEFCLIDLATGQIAKKCPSVGNRIYTPAAADLNGDGLPEFVLISPENRYPSLPAACIAMDGSLSTLWQTTVATIGSYIAVAGDIDGDGISEVVLTLPGGIRALDGRTGQTKWTWNSPAAPVNTVLADISGDGFPEVIAGISGTAGGVQVLNGNGIPAWFCPMGGSGTVKVIRDGASKVYAHTGTYLVDMTAKKPLWRIGDTANAIADVDGDGRLELITKGGCIDAFDPLGAKSAVQIETELITGLQTNNARPYRAADGSLWLATSMGFSYYDPASSQFGAVPMRTGFPYFPVSGCWFKTGPEGLNVYSGSDWVGTIDTQSKKLLGEHQSGITGPSQDPYPNQFEWEGSFYSVSKGYSTVTLVKDATTVNITAWYSSNNYGFVGVGPGQTAFALVGNELYSYSFTQKTTAKKAVPVTATAPFNGAVQVGVDRALVYVPTSSGKVLYSFNPLTLAFDPVATEQNLKDVYKTARGKAPSSLTVSMLPGPNGTCYISLSDGPGLPYLVLLPAGSAQLQPIGDFLGWAEAWFPRVRNDKSLSFIIPGPNLRVKTVLPGGGTVTTEIPSKINNMELLLTTLAPNGDYCIINPYDSSMMLHRVSPTGQYSSIELVDFPYARGIAFATDPDILYIAGEDGYLDMALSAYHLSSGAIDCLAPGKGLSIIGSADGRIYFTTSAQNGPVEQFVYQPGAGVVKLGSWMAGGAGNATLLGFDGERILAVTGLNSANLELWSMNASSGQVTRLGEADPSLFPVRGGAFSPQELFLYYAQGGQIWRWDALCETGGDPESPGDPAEIAEEVVWTGDFRLDSMGGLNAEHRELLNNLEKGQYRLNVSFTTERGQKVGQATRPFAVGDGVAGLVLVPEGTVKVGSPQEFTAAVANLSADAQSIEAVLTIEPQGKAPVEIKRVALNVGPGQTETVPFTVDLKDPMTAVVRLELLSGGQSIGSYQGRLKVAEPQVEAGIVIPSEVTREPFVATAWVRNTGEVPVNLAISSAALGLSGQTVTLAAGETWSTTGEVANQDGSPLVVQITGDWTGQASATPNMVQTVWLKPEIESVYPDGQVSPQILLANTGKVCSTFLAQFEVMTGGIMMGQNWQAVDLAPEQSAYVRLPLDLKPGIYSAVWRTPFGDGQTYFEVKPRYAAGITASCAEEGTQLRINMQAVNQGLWSLDGVIEVLTGSDRSSAPIRIPAGGSQAVSAVLPLPLKAGTHPVTIRVAVNGNTVAETTINYTREQTVSASADFRLESLPDDLLVLATGESRDIEVVVVNRGLAAGQAVVGLANEDLPVQTEAVELAPGAQQTLRFTLMVPTDRESGTYRAVVLVNGNAIGQFAYTVQGIKLQVNASTDRTAYRSGETVQLTLQVAKVSGRANLPLVARVKFGTFEETRTLTLDGSDTLKFSIPVRDFSQKLFFGFYEGDTERSLYLDTLYIYEDNDEALVLTDKQAYSAGDTVAVELTPHTEGVFTVEGPGGFSETVNVEETDLESPVQLAIPLAPVLPSGTYSIRVTLGDGLIEHNIDVGGVRLELLNGKLDKELYLPGETIRAALTYSSNAAVSGVLQVQGTGSDGRTVTLAEQNFDFVQGKENRLTIATPTGSSLSGIAYLRLVLKTRDGVHLAANTVYFKMGRIDIERISTDKPAYPAVNVPVTGSVFLTGTGTGTLTLMLDGRTFGSMPVELNGRATVPFSLPAGSMMRPGSHRIDAALACGTETATGSMQFEYGTDLPDLMVADIAAGRIPDGEGRLPVDITVINTGRMTCTETTVQLKAGDQIVGTATAGSIPGQGGTATVRLLWDIGELHGKVSLTVVLNAAGTVSEFNRDNNTFTREFGIPARPSVEPFADMIGAIPFGLHGTADPGTLVVFENNGVYLAECAADRQGNFETDDIQLDDGLHVLTCYAINTEGRTSRLRELGKVLVDTVPPEIRLSGVSDGMLTNGNVDIAIEIVDANLASSAVTLDGLARRTAFTVTEEGMHTLQIQAADVVGHSASQIVTFIIDKTPPVITIIGPAEGGCYEPPVCADVRVEDAHPGEVHAFLDGQPYTPGTAIETLGPHALVARATDQAGNQSGKTVNFVIRPKLESGLRRVVAMRALVFADGCQGAEVERFVSTTLQGMGVASRFVSSADDFVTEMQSGEFNTFVILDGAKTVSSAKEREVLEALRRRVSRGDTGIYVYAGQGGDTPHYFGRGDSTPFPGKFEGTLPPKVWTVNLADGAFTAGKTVTVDGKCLRIALESGEVLGTVEKNGVFPVLYKASLGKGMTAVMAFAPGADDASGRAQLGSLFSELLGKVPPCPEPEIGRLTAYEWTLTNTGSLNVQLGFTVQLPVGARIVETVWPAGQGSTAEVALAPGESVKLRFFVAGETGAEAPRIAVTYRVGENRYDWGVVSLTAF